jgi:uncharacterized protein YndB with AHSA1/START domain
MLSSPRPACLVIADISGYTSYLAGVELDHAQDILADLMDTVVRAMRPAFRLAKLEGDAAFVYAVTDRVDGSVLQDTVEGCYFAFQRRQRDVRQATTCPCNACTLIPTLDLKLIAHHGLVAEQRMAGRVELMGRDVIVVHRLLKNSIEADLGIGAYALYTEACVEAMGLDDPAGAGLRPHRETYDAIGEVAVWVRDLAAAWRAEQDRVAVVVEPSETGWSVEADLPGPPSLAWTFLTAPEHRLRWQAGITGFEEQTVQGRRGIGTVNHCRHGKDMILEEILDWRPPQHQTVRVQLPIPGAPRLTFSDVLEPATGDTTHFTMRVQRPRARKDRDIAEAVWPGIEASVRAGIDSVESLLRAELDRLVDADVLDVDSVETRSS